MNETSFNIHLYLPMNWPALLITAIVALSPAPFAAAQSTKRPAAEESAAQPSKLFPHLGKHLVIISDGSSHGSGSIIMMGGKPLIVTNAHVLSGLNQVTFRRVDDTALKVEKLAVAHGADVATFTQTVATEGLELMNDVGTKANIGDDVVVLGNSQGMSVITEIPGKIVGIGPSEIEVDAKFVPGNSGSPIIHVKSGKVIAIATRALGESADPLVQDSRFGKWRRFGYRLDTLKKWDSPSWGVFQQEARVLAAVSKHSEDLLLVYTQSMAKAGLTLANFADGNRLKRFVVDYLQILNRSNMAVSSKQEARLKFFRSMIFECGYDLPTLRPETFGNFHGGMLRDEIQTREKLKKAFQQLSTGSAAVDKITTP